MFLKKNLITFGLLAAMAAMMASCTNEDLMYNPQLEEYTRAFIKEFGKIDPEQDWNMAQEANVTLNFGSRQAETVKVYAKHENKYYLVADLVQLSGQVTVPIDIPQTTTDLMVYVDGTSYYCKTNTQLNCESGGSRCELIDSKSVTGGGSRATGDTYAATVTSAAAKIFNAQEIAPITENGVWTTYYSLTKGRWYESLGISGILPENRPNNSDDDQTISDEVKNISGFEFNKDFRYKIGGTGVLTIYPYFYGTPDKHTLGIYFIDDDGYPLKKDGTPIKTIDPSTIRDETNGVGKYPIYSDRADNDIKIYPHPVYDITGVKCIVSNLQMSTSDVFDISPYVFVKGKDKNRTGDGTYFSYDDLKNGFTTRFAFKFPTGYSYEVDGDRGWYTNYTNKYQWYCDRTGKISSSITGENTLTISAQGYGYWDNDNNVYVNAMERGRANTVTVPVKITDSSTNPSYTLKEFILSEAKPANDGSFTVQCEEPQYFTKKKDSNSQYSYSSGQDTNITTDLNAYVSGYNDGTVDVSSDQIIIYGSDNWSCYMPFPSNSDYSITSSSLNYYQNEYKNYIKFEFTFTPKNSTSNSTNTPSTTTSTYPYDPSVYLTESGEPCGWQSISPGWDNYRMNGEESSAYYTIFPMLVKAPGYKVNLTKNGAAYNGRIGLYIDVLNSDVTVKNTYFSQKHLNRYSYDSDYLTSKTSTSYYSSRGSDVDFEYVYAYTYTHPTTLERFFSFEDWNITHPSLLDESVDGNYTGYAYSPVVYYNGSINSGDYSSDRDDNDLIFMMDSEDLVVESKEWTEVVEVDNAGLSWLWAIEDLGSTDDFDFNDVIIRITSITTNRTTTSYTTTTTTNPDTGNVTEETVAGTPTTQEGIYKKVQLTPFAAGGTLPIYIHYYDGTNNYTLAPGTYDLTKTGTTISGIEFHEWFGTGTSSGQMINTKNGTASKTIDVDNMSCVLLLNSKFSISWKSETWETAQNMGDAYYQNSFYVTVKTDSNVNEMLSIDADKAQETEGYLIGESYQGGAPQSFILLEIPDGDNKFEWKWPVERMSITAVYTDFGNWVGNKNQYADWYKSTTSEAVCTRVKSSTSNTYTIQ